MRRSGRHHPHAHDERLVSGPSRAEVHTAIEALPDKFEWSDMASRVRPMFVRRRPLPPGAERPLTFRVPPGVNEALEQAMSNLKASVEAERYFELEYGTIAEVPVWWYQSHGGLASGLLLVE